MRSSHFSCHKYRGKCCTSLYTEFDQCTVRRATVTACKSKARHTPAHQGQAPGDSWMPPVSWDSCLHAWTIWVTACTQFIFLTFLWLAIHPGLPKFQVWQRPLSKVKVQWAWLRPLCTIWNSTVFLWSCKASLLHACLIWAVIEWLIMSWTGGMRSLRVCARMLNSTMSLHNSRTPLITFPARRTPTGERKLQFLNLLDVIAWLFMMRLLKELKLL